MENYYALDEKKAEDYVRKLGLFPQTSHLVTKEIGDGNLNLVFQIRESESNYGIIIKQALPYARVVGESWPLTLDRARIESEALKVQYMLCPDSVPKVYFYDAQLALTVMEDLSSYDIMRTGLIQKKRYPKFADQIGVFLARTLFFTSDLTLDPQEKKKRQTQFINPEMCKITEDLVFTHPYYDADTNQFNPLIENEVKEIWDNDKLKFEIAKLKEGFLTRGQALIHGDLHTGSIMVTNESIKVIDPEFAFYGPMGFDIGAVIANLLLNYASQEGNTSSNEQKEFKNYLLISIEQLWYMFEQTFRKLWEENVKGPLESISGYVDDYLLRVLQDTSGYAGCKMMRRIIGLAHVRDLENINDPLLRAKAEKSALSIGQILILNRNKINTIHDLISLVKGDIK